MFWEIAAATIENGVKNPIGSEAISQNITLSYGKT
jgi:hypothetical protein